MTKWASLSLSLVFLLLTFNFCRASGGYLTVLVYHRFGEDKHPSTNISQEYFREQMEYLKKEKYQVLSLEEVGEFCQKKKDFPEKAILITIDDGYRSVYQVAYPILKEFDYPFTVFLYSESIEKRYPAMVSSEMIEEMKNGGATFGNHTHTHPHLGIPAADITEEGYRLWVREEIRKCRQFLQKYGIESYSIAFPYGEYNQIILEEAENLGYDLLFSQDPGSTFTPSGKELLFPRQAIAGENMTLQKFKEKLACPPLEIVSPQPSSGFLESADPGQFAARLLHPDDYRSGIINMFVSELGRLEAHFDPDTGWIRAVNQKALTRPMNWITITAREKNSPHFARVSWLISLPPPWISQEES